MSRLTEAVTHDSTNSVTDGVFDRVPDRGDPTWYVLGLALALFIGFSVYTAVLHARFATTGADLGAYTHMFSSTLDGQGWLNNGKYRVEIPSSSYWGAHFSLTLLLFLPLYALVQSVYTLLIAKSFVLAASVVVLWVLARDRLESDRLAGVVTLSYAFNPFLWSAWSFDFQEQVLIPPLLFAAYYCYRKDRTLAFFLFFALVLVTNEFVIFPAIGFTVGLAVAAAVAGRLRKKAVPIFGAVVLIGLARYVSSTVIDHFSRTGGLPSYVITDPLQPLIAGTPRVSLLDLLGAVLTNPAILFDSATVAADEKLLFFVAFMLPVLFLAIFDELSLFALAPYLGFAWVFTGQAKAVYFEFGAHYPLYLLPFVYIGVIHLLRRLSGRFDRLALPSRPAFAGAFAAVCLLCLAAGVVSGGGQLTVPPPADGDHRDTLNTAIEGIPENATLIAQNDIYPHVATRPNAKFIVSQRTFAAFERRYAVTPEYVLIDTELNPDAQWAGTVQESYGDRLDDEYGLVQYQDGIQVFERGYDGPVSGITQPDPSPRLYDAGDLRTGTGERENGRIVSQDGSADRSIWYGPYETLASGNYTATFRLDVSGTGSEPVVLVDVAGGEEHERIASERVAATDGWQNVTVPFTLDETTAKVEFRGLRQGKGRVVLDSVRVEYGSKNATTNPTGGNS